MPNVPLFFNRKLVQAAYDSFHFLTTLWQFIPRISSWLSLLISLADQVVEGEMKVHFNVMWNLVSSGGGHNLKKGKPMKPWSRIGVVILGNSSNLIRSSPHLE